MRSAPALALATAATLAAALVPATAANAVAPALTGKVVFHGAPQVGVTVGWFEPDTDDERTTVTAADGTYSLALPAAGTKYVVFAGLPHASAATTDWPNDEPVRPKAQKAGSVGVYVGFAGQSYAYQSTRLFTAGTAPKALPPITLGDAAVIRGTGGPDLAKRGVHLQNLHGDDVGAVSADATGAFRMEVVPGDYRVVVPADATHLEWRSATRVTATAGTDRVVSVQRALGATLAGVVTSSGKAVGGAAVRAGDRSTRTAADGTWSIAGVPLGVRSVRFGAVGNTTALHGYVPLTKPVSGLASGVTTQVNASLVLGGLIKATYDSAPGADRYVFVVTRSSRYGGIVTGDERDASATTSRNTVVASGLPAGTYDVRVSDRDGARYAERLVTLTAGQGVNLGVLAPTKRTVSLEGTVSGASTGEVVAVAKNFSSYASASASGGRYALFGLLPGSYRVLYMAPNRLLSTTSAGLAKDTTLKLSAGGPVGRLAGVVYAGDARTDGVDVRDEAGMSASFLDDSGLDAWAGVDGLEGTAAPGTHRIVGVEPWADPFQAFSPYWYAWPDPSITLVAGQTTRLSVHLLLEGDAGATPAAATASSSSSSSASTSPAPVETTSPAPTGTITP
ncbi:carboxypeptidase regulatory-like domain-containing protein [Amnibacterium sp. CER49]|uniref:carboxypeptidase regulatory-like domain-containing protein n=1 Tax=Amnibacterium sp. CER49 TaxID=3039161 RepID=UPI0024469EFA|nr:carboxypeptidase regulatory-like domain-containing protein [Amnibacterium sp. CER49]MDH2445236.1 carboxypeptidase regulatory-like domain-containing protein [Amnibacterium sp. CER49]